MEPERVVRFGVALEAMAVGLIILVVEYLYWCLGSYLSV